MKKLAGLTLATATIALLTTPLKAETLKNPQKGALCSAWVVEKFEKFTAPEQAKNAYFADKSETLSPLNVKNVVWNQILVSWEGYVNIKSDGEYTFIAKSIRTDRYTNGYPQAGGAVDVGGKRIIEYKNSRTAAATQGTGSIKLKAGLNYVKVWMYADEGRQSLQVSYRKEGALTEYSFVPNEVVFDAPEE